MQEGFSEGARSPVNRPDLVPTIPKEDRMTALKPGVQAPDFSLSTTPVTTTLQMSPKVRLLTTVWTTRTSMALSSQHAGEWSPAVKVTSPLRVVHRAS